MRRILLRFLNSPALILITLIGVALQTSFFTFWLLPYFQPDVVLIVTLWCAFRRNFLEGGVLTLILADVAGIHSAAPRGLFLIIYMSVYLLVRLAARVFVIPDLSAYVLVTVGATVLTKLGSLGVLHLMSMNTGDWKHMLLFLFPGALMNAMIANWAFQSLDKFDWITFKNARADQLTEYPEYGPEYGDGLPLDGRQV